MEMEAGRLLAGNLGLPLLGLMMTGDWGVTMVGYWLGTRLL